MYIDGMELPVFKATLHNHSTSSDGVFTVTELATLYRDAGYDVFAISDHRVANDITGISIPGITLLSGIELHPMGPRGILWHILALGVPGDFPGNIYKSGKEAVDAAKAIGALVYAAHPNWCGLNVEEILELGQLQGLEVINASCRLQSRQYSDEIWDQMLQSGARPCYGLGTEDCHDWTSFGQAWTMIAAENRSPEAIYDALRKGRFYATQGPDFHSIELKDGHFRATFTEAVSAVLVSNYDQGACARVPRWPMPGCEKPLATSMDIDVSSWPKGSYIRCQITDAKGHMAFSQPYFL